MSVIDLLLRNPQCIAVLTSDEIREEMIRQLDAKRFSGRDVAGLLSIAPARVTEMRNRGRRVQQHEMKPLAEYLGLLDSVDGPASAAVLRHDPIAPEVIAPLLADLAPLWPKGRVTDQSLRAVAEALSHGLALLEDPTATATSLGEIRLAARAAMSRSRDQG